MSRHGTGPRGRDELVEALTLRMTRAIFLGKPWLFLKRSGEREAAELAEVTDLETDIGAAFAVGMYHWNRISHVPPDQVEREYALALELLTRVHPHDPARVPQSLRIQIEQRDREAADTALSTAENDDDPAATLVAIDRLRSVLAQTPADSAEYAELVTWMGNAMAGLFEDSSPAGPYRTASTPGEGGEG